MNPEYFALRAAGLLFWSGQLQRANPPVSY
jgi:hypothetical protein